jgi:uncharacterized LabA/DUF88 family protein
MMSAAQENRMAYALPRYNGPKEVKYLFVDGGCLRAVLTRFSDRYFGGIEIELEYNKFLNEFTKCFYYDAYPSQKPGQSDADYEAIQKDFQARAEHIAETRGWHVYEGEAIHRRKRGMEQKKVDVMIAVDMLRHTFRGNMHGATLLTSDLDFKPLLDALVSEGMYVQLWYPPGETSGQLARAADARIHLNLPNFQYYFTARFLTANPLPEATSGMLDTSMLTHLYRGAARDGQELNVWRNETDGRLVLSAPPNPQGHGLKIQHRSWEMIVKWAEDWQRIELAPDFAFAE